MWGLLGFSWEQFNSDSTDINRSVRITEENKDSLKHLTTNCEIVASDTLAMNVNPWGAVLYTTQVPIPRVLAGPNSSTIGDEVEYYFGATQDTSVVNAIPNLPVITEKTDSIWITAAGLPRKMLQPYYTIRSSLIEKGNMIGGETSNSLLPVMAICDKQYSGGDFVFFNSNNLQFRITKPQTLSSITTSIHDPGFQLSTLHPTYHYLLSILLKHVLSHSLPIHPQLLFFLPLRLNGFVFQLLFVFYLLGL